MKLRINNLNKTYQNGVRAINDLNLEIDSGMFGLLGPNGAGKSSLMRTIATLQYPDSGSIFFNDIDIIKQPMSLRKILGYLPQDFGVYQKVSAVKLLDYFAVLKGVTQAKERNHLVDYVLELTNLTAFKNKHVSSYSGGMKQRFGIAQLLLNDPRLIIVDEPTAGLDPSERNRFLNVLRDIGTDNIVIFSTHLVEDVKELCSDMAIIDKGRVLSKTTPSDALRSLQGKIWKSEIDKNEFEFFNSKFHVLSSGINDKNKLSLRIYSDENLGVDFKLVEPNLEDVYFETLKHNKSKTQA